MTSTPKVTPPAEKPKQPTTEHDKDSTDGQTDHGVYPTGGGVGPASDDGVKHGTNALPPGHAGETSYGQPTSERLTDGRRGQQT